MRLINRKRLRVVRQTLAHETLWLLAASFALAAVLIPALVGVVLIPLVFVCRIIGWIHQRVNQGATA